MEAKYYDLANREGKKMKMVHVALRGNLKSKRGQ